MSKINWDKLITKEDKFEQMRQAKFDEIANARYEEEVSGIEINGHFFNTDRESRIALNERVFCAIQDENYVCNWKMKSGFVELNAEEIKDIANLVDEHVQGAFSKEAELIPLIENAETLKDLDKIKWQ